MLEAMRNRLSRPRAKPDATPATEPEPKLLRLLDDGVLDLTPPERFQPSNNRAEG